MQWPQEELALVPAHLGLQHLHDQGIAGPHLVRQHSQAFRAGAAHQDHLMGTKLNLQQGRANVQLSLALGDMHKWMGSDTSVYLARQCKGCALQALSP